MYVLIPKTCTNRLQPIDLSVNKPIKDRLKTFQNYYACEIQTEANKSDLALTPVDFCLSTIKPLHAQWIIDAYDYIKSKPVIIRNGFKAAGIID